MRFQNERASVLRIVGNQDQFVQGTVQRINLSLLLTHVLGKVLDRVDAVFTPNGLVDLLYELRIGHLLEVQLAHPLDDFTAALMDDLGPWDKSLLHFFEVKFFEEDNPNKVEDVLVEVLQEKLIDNGHLLHPEVTFEKPVFNPVDDVLDSSTHQPPHDLPSERRFAVAE
eukprot:CAMPEP_0170479742 /NCGR_PEP_ID=MMETSP0208-20121228/863_1 /TAXON_ID=197538 /ORGANISM="Strombidium inclinatum, Strain S3" /LENGTH=168 /DNA_ID=CAMNT_0010752193 /DNA_START=956 /DNA_END=1462 /DNA_ORIENTATION=+